MKPIQQYMIAVMAFSLFASQYCQSGSIANATSNAGNGAVSTGWQRLADERLRAAEARVKAEKTISLSNAIHLTGGSSSYQRVRNDPRYARDNALVAESKNILDQLSRERDTMTREESNRLMRRLEEIHTNRFPLATMQKLAVELSDLICAADLIVIGTVVTPTNATVILPDGKPVSCPADPRGILVDIPGQQPCILSQFAVEEIVASLSDENTTMMDLAVMDNIVTGVYILTRATRNRNLSDPGDPSLCASTRVLLFLKTNDIDISNCEPVLRYAPLHIAKTSAVYRVVEGIKGDVNVDIRFDSFFRDYEIATHIANATSRFEVVECTRLLAQAMSVHGTNGLDSLMRGPVSGLLCRTALRLKESSAPKLFKTTGIHIEQQLLDCWGKPIPMQHGDKNLK